MARRGTVALLALTVVITTCLQDSVVIARIGLPSQGKAESARIQAAIDRGEVCYIAFYYFPVQIDLRSEMRPDQLFHVNSDHILRFRISGKHNAATELSSVLSKSTFGPSKNYNDYRYGVQVYSRNGTVVGRIALTEGGLGTNIDGVDASTSGPLFSFMLQSTLPLRKRKP